MCRSTPRNALALVAALSAITCAQKLPGDDPGEGVLLYYPTSLAQSPNGDYAYIVNTNFDQQFNTGWITSVNIASLVANPNNPRGALTRQVYIPSLGGRIAVTPDGTRAFVPHRGTSRLTVLELAGGAVSCGDSGNQANLSSTLKNTSCDSDHLIDLTGPAQAATVNLPFYPTYNYRDFQDPYAVAVLQGTAGLQSSGYTTPVLVGYQQSGWLTVLDANDTVPSVKTELFVGSTTLVNVQPFGPNRALASSRRAAQSTDIGQIYDIDIEGSLSPTAYPRQQAQVVNGDVGNGLAGLDIVNTVFSPDQQRLYCSTRSPDSVSVLRLRPFGNTTKVVSPGAAPVLDDPWHAWRPVSAAPLDDTDPSDLVYLQRGADDLIAVASLFQDSIYFLSTAGDQLQVVQRISMTNGQGPFGMLHVKHDGGDYLLVSTFFDHGLIVIDVSSPSYNDFHILTEVHQDDLGVAPRGR